MDNIKKREIIFMFFGIFFMILGSYLVISAVSWTLWFGIFFMLTANNVSQRYKSIQGLNK